ncbi:hypothetical protein F7230_06955 [Corynebacterium sp. 320]|nr:MULTISPECIES: YiiX/YebB-like N1pC/P60 family cysteine hydrolase [Corynebacterium]KAB1502748.1 hypothetical protein F7230_06955 [Corynebacterium sp. 320]KAB1550514.1 hypothetical protein F7232_09555 [Corynebacterium sp. 319]KAB1554758.1 hypothetical protein F7233_00270 [Corynebacterium sp. 321]KAB3526411.1 hypothetical protein F8354_06955 [Corynebacterium sp. 250]QNP92333.1 hypothetical protein IAU67_00350 [Corynebacterium zhongnanshanii]
MQVKRSCLALLTSVVAVMGLVPTVAADEGKHAAGVTNPFADVVAPGREGLVPGEAGFGDNVIDNHAGAGWVPTADPKARVVVGGMRSDREEIPGGFSKEQADRAEVQEAAERQGVGFRGVGQDCRTYWPSPYKVCGAIREKYDQLGGPQSFLTWPKSDELGVPDGVGRRSEFVNGFIYWHPTTGAHPVTTHFSAVWARNGWEAGRMGYPVSDEYGLGDGVGRRQDFQRAHVFGSLAGLASVEGRIFDRWVEIGAEGGPLGYPVADEAGTPDGQGRFSRFTGGMVYWHPRHGAHEILGSVLTQWSQMGYERSRLGYPVSAPESNGAFRLTQAFENGKLNGYESPVPELAQLLEIDEAEIDAFYQELEEDFKAHGIDVREGFLEAFRRGQESLDFTDSFNPDEYGIDPDQIVRKDSFTLSRACTPPDFVKPGNERTNRGDLFYSKAVRYKVINHGHNGIFVTSGKADAEEIATVEAVSPEKGVQRLVGKERIGVCKPVYLSVNTDNSTRERAATWAESKVGKGYQSNFATTRIGKIDRDSYNCSQLVWAAYKHASGGGLDIGEKFPYEPYQPAVYPKDILDSHNTRIFR